MDSQEERDNYFSLTLLLFRVGNQKLREYFKTQWPNVYQRVRPGTVPPPWNDTPHDAAEMKKIQPSKLKFKFKDEKTKFNSGNTSDWDFSLLTSVLLYSSLQFVLPSSPESKALDDLKKIRNELIGHATDAAIPNALFHTAWTDACNALALFNASDADFKCVQDDVNKPWNVLYPMLQQCVKQEQEIKDSVDTIINRIEHLQQTVEQQHTSLQQTVEKQHETQLEAARNVERKIDLMLSQGQQGQKRSTADVQPVDLVLSQGLKEEQAHQLQVEEFGKYKNLEHQVPVTDLQEISNRIKYSVGAIIAINISNLPNYGATCFRIGTKYVITNKYVVDDISKLAIQLSSCYVDFNYKEQDHPGYRFGFAPNPVRFYSEALNYVILELRSNGEGFPPSVTDLGYNIVPPGHKLKSGDCLTFIGHPGERRKQIDVSCPIKLLQDIQKHRRDYDARAISLMEEACNHPDYATYNVSTLFGGSSGSLGILMEKKLLVVLHTAGIFQCTNHVLEYGILMSSVVKDVMTKIENTPIQNVNLDEIFGGSTSSIFDQCSLW